MPTRPNILLILTDQQSASMMSCAGNPWLRTPALDSLAADGMRFDRAYSTNPVSIPSRFSLMTGHMPSEIGLRSCDTSGIDPTPQGILDGGLGWLMRKAGYKAAYAGKVHLPRMTAEDIGFETICKDERDVLAEEAAAFVTQDHDQPFFLCASFINPHDICYQAIRDFAETDEDKALLARGQLEIAALDLAHARPEGIDETEFFRSHCPPLPDNHEPQVDEPEAIRRHLEDRPFKMKARQNYTANDWRSHRWAYARLTERVDAQIGRVLKALRAGGNANDTVVIFTSDHGDHDSAHKLEHKTIFYEEACRIPLIVSQPGVTPSGVCPDLVSNGLDLVPTLCDYAGIQPPTGLQGHSIKSQAEAESAATPRSFVPMENSIGRAVVTGGFKYILYDEGINREQLMDLEADPGETRNALADPDRQADLEACRACFTDHFGPEHETRT